MSRCLTRSGAHLLELGRIAFVDLLEGKRRTVCGFGMEELMNFR
jgi:hypothetical protein